MERRNFSRTLAAGGAGLLAMTGLSKAEGARAGKVAYHLDDVEKVGPVLLNIRNHIKGTGGPGKVEIVLVVHGPALKAFEAGSAMPDVENALATLKWTGSRSMSAATRCGRCRST